MPQFVQGDGHQVILAATWHAVRSQIPVGTRIQVYLDVVLARIQFRAGEGIGQGRGIPGLGNRSGDKILAAVRKGDAEGAVPSGAQFTSTLMGTGEISTPSQIEAAWSIATCAFCGTRL